MFIRVKWMNASLELGTHLKFGYTHTHTRTHAHTHTYTQTYMYIYIHICVRKLEKMVKNRSKLVTAQFNA
jgi:hypothetical protein